MKILERLVFNYKKNTKKLEPESNTNFILNIKPKIEQETI